ncbi:MAG TPA: phage tail tube protein [Microvirga sp.]|jgi:predicted secreted protein|nr:phage tail tube protein [Microvirga sp.]
MAKPTTLSSAKLVAMLGNGATPEVFSAPCGLTARNINFSKETNDVNVPDCDDPDAPAWVERSVVSLSSTIGGSGILALEALPTWREAYLDTDSKNVRMLIDSDSSTTGGYFSGKFHLTTFNITGELGDKIQVEVEFQNDGPVLWTAAA